MMKEYISPIILIQKEISKKIEDDVYKTVLGYDIAVDKKELIKALEYDRNQYNRGYQDGVNSVINKINNFKDEINMCFEKLIGDNE